MVNYYKLKKDQINNNEKMQNDIFNRFKWNIEHDEDEADFQDLTDVYSNFSERFLLQYALDIETDKDLIEDINFISNELKVVADSIFAKMFL